MLDPPARDGRPTSVIVAVEVRLYREVISDTLAGAGLRLAGDVSTAHELTALAERARPDVALVDTGLPGVLEALRHLGASAPAMRVLALGLPRDDDEVVAVAELGVAGFIDSNSSLADLVPAIRMAMNGEAPCTARIAATLLRRVAAAAQSPCDDGLAELTSREREILELVNAGLSNKEIAFQLVIGLSTVKSHVHAILRKLDVEHRSAAAARLRGAA